MHKYPTYVLYFINLTYLKCSARKLISDKEPAVAVQIISILLWFRPLITYSPLLP